jgi:hypothetical protein
LKFEKIFNPIDGFEFEVLDDPDFKEDSVREEIISPIIKAAGYGLTKPSKIIRSKPLEHPFVSIGSARKKITCIPDYLFEVNDRYAWILEAKGPSENILEGKHVEQAYSYAIHSEIRVPLFALCNGREFALYHISKYKPLLHFNMRSIAKYFDNLKKYISPQNVLEADFKLAKDFGLTGRIPDQTIDLLMKREEGHRKNVQFSDGVFRVNIDCRVGDELQENSDEIFLPFIINRIL